MMKIKDLFAIKKGKKAIELIQDSGLRYIQIEDLRNNDSYKFAQESKSNVLCDINDVLIAWDGANAGTVGYNLVGVIGSTLAKLTPKTEHVFSEYVGRFLQSKFKFLRDNCTGATIPHISRPVLENLQIPLPPLATQKKIAAILDQADKLRQLNKQLIAKYDALSQSLFLDMFGDPVTNPKGWEKKPLGELLEFLTSGSRGWAKYYTEEGDIFLRIQNVGYDCLKTDDFAFVNPPEIAESKRTKVESGDIILSITADLGRSAVIPKSLTTAYISQHLALLRLAKNHIPRYVSAYIASKGGQMLFNKLDKGGVKAGLNFTDIKSYKVSIPPIALQNLFAERIQAIEAQKAQAQQALQKSEDLFNSLLQRAFKGELVG